MRCLASAVHIVFLPSGQELTGIKKFFRVEKLLNFMLKMYIGGYHLASSLMSFSAFFSS
jgi:hypothetical protein